jgi:hypothetical protein
MMANWLHTLLSTGTPVDTRVLSTGTPAKT